MAGFKLVRPKSSFAEWMREKSIRQFNNDLAWIAYIGYEATKESSKLSDKRKAQITKIVISKISKRLNELCRDGTPVLWDERNWRPLRKLDKEVKR